MDELDRWLVERIESPVGQLAVFGLILVVRILASRYLAERQRRRSHRHKGAGHA